MGFIIRGRKAWTSRKVSTTPRGKRWVSVLVFHHTAGKPAYTYRDAVEEMRNMEAYHIGQRGWNAIGYNIVMDRRGRCWEGRGLDVVPAGATGHNTTGMHVSVMGDYTKLRLTLRQKMAIRRLRALLYLKGYRFKRVCGHNDLSGHESNACPGSIKADLNLR